MAFIPRTLQGLKVGRAYLAVYLITQSGSYYSFSRGYRLFWLADNYPRIIPATNLDILFKTANEAADYAEKHLGERDVFQLTRSGLRAFRGRCEDRPQGVDWRSIE